MYDLESPNLKDGSVGAQLDEYLFYLFTQVVNRRNRDFLPALEALGLSLSEWRALSVMNRLDGCLMTELSDFTTVDRTTLTRTVDHLVKAGLVARSVLPQDRRQVMVQLTEKGKTQFNQAVEALKAHNACALQGLAPDDLTTLRALLQQILGNIVKDPAQLERLILFQR